MNRRKTCQLCYWSKVKIFYTIFFCVKLIYSLHFEIFDTVDFLTHVWPFVLFKNFYEICKIICLRKNIFNNESNDRKRINNYLNFLNKTNDQTCNKKSTASNISKRREYVLWIEISLTDGIVYILHYSAEIVEVEYLNTPSIDEIQHN